MTTDLAVSYDHPVHWHLIEARGDDTVAFLQGQLSCDVLATPSGASTAGLVLTPAGEVITSLDCRHHPEGRDLVVRAEALDATLSSLRRFLLRTKCELRDAGEIAATAARYGTVGEQVLTGEPGPHEFAQGLGAHSFGQSFVNRHVSFTKGCFTGQELVGRLDSRGGNVPFRLARVRGPQLELMAAVVASAGPTGERARQGLTSVVRGEDYVALALVHRTLLGEASSGSIDAVTIEVIP